MKTCHLFFLSLVLGCPLSAQHKLESRLNNFRAEDEIIKQQVDYKDPGRSGKNVLWDFSRLHPVNPEYSLTYMPPLLEDETTIVMGKDTLWKAEVDPANLTIGVEHGTMYYYQLKGDSLLLLGHENPLTLMHHRQPVLLMRYPFGYGDSLSTHYHSDALYSSSHLIQTRGDLSVHGDAYGMMILPNKDTLLQVIRVRTVQHIADRDTIRQEGDTPLNMEIETCRWYAKGYRYPVFETTRTTNLHDSIRSESFSTAFFYPPQEHYYLEEDEANRRVLEKENNEDNEGHTNPWEGLTYNFYPNPVINNLEMEFFMPREGHVRMQMINRMGLTIWKEDFGTWSPGTHTTSVFMASFGKGEYILNIWLDDYLIGEKIVKR